MKNATKKIIKGLGYTVVAIGAICICKKIFGAYSDMTESLSVDHHLSDYQEFWLKDGTNAIVNTWDGEVNQVDIYCQSFETLPDALKELVELAKDMHLDPSFEFSTVSFSAY